MTSNASRLALEELARRKKAQETYATVEASIRSELFDKQLAFMDDPSRNKAALCTRRAGKTSMWARYATITALKHRGCLIRIWAINRLRCKQLLWQEFLNVAARHKIPVDKHETELTIRFANGSEIRLLGADKDKEAQKKRGDKTALEVVLETQLFGPFLRTLVEDVVEPCLFDMKGTLCLEGTPGPLPAGYWFAVTGDDNNESRWESTGKKVGDDVVGAGWSCHRWSLTDNPFVDQWRGNPNWRAMAKEAVEQIRIKRRWTTDNPTYVREYTGHWAKDEGVLYYKFAEGRNTFSVTDTQPWGPGWKHTLGWDLGSLDDMSLVVWGWHPEQEVLYEAFSWKKPGALADEIVEKIRELEKRFDIISMVADTGGGGKMFVEEVMSRYGLVFSPAKKTDKYDHVRLFNDGLLTGKTKLQVGSPLALEMATLPKDPDWDPESGKPPAEDPRFANHCCFVAGTLVTTARGDIPVETLQVGDSVLGRDGWHNIALPITTYEAEVITNVGLTGTPEHPIWTKNRGWVRLDEVVASDVLLYSCEKLESNSEPCGTGTQHQNEEPTENTFVESKKEKSCTCTVSCGNEIKDLSLRSTMYITKTETAETTQLKTLCVCQGDNTCRSTEQNILSETEETSLPPCQTHNSAQKNGTLQPKEGNGTQSTQGESTMAKLTTDLCAKFVTQALSQRLQAQKCAPRSVTQSDEGNAAPTTQNSLVTCAENLLQKTNTASRHFVRSLAQVFSVTATGPVGEYFANGILVKNCDASLYSWRAAFPHLDFTGKPEKETEDQAHDREFIDLLSKRNQKREWWEPDEDDYSGIASAIDYLD